VPFQLGYRPKSRRPRFFSRGLRECLNLETENGQTNPEGPARLTRRLIMDLVCIVIFEAEYNMGLPLNAAKLLVAAVKHTAHRKISQ
jgi:hypothetical protein